jgi:hypothetical protein
MVAAWAWVTTEVVLNNKPMAIAIIAVLNFFEPLTIITPYLFDLQ